MELKRLISALPSDNERSSRSSSSLRASISTAKLSTGPTSMPMPIELRIPRRNEDSGAIANSEPAGLRVAYSAVQAPEAPLSERFGPASTNPGAANDAQENRAALTAAAMATL